MIRLAASLAILAGLLPATPVHADEDEAPVEVTLEPWAAYDGEERPFRYVVTMRARGSAPVEVVADRRLLSFRVRRLEGRRRRYRCRHPRARRRPDDDRVRTLAPGEVWREWVDLRMYCWGRALDALTDGAEVEGRYGWRRRTRRRWVARAPESSWREWTGGVALEDFTFPAMEEGATRRLDADEGQGAEPPPVELGLTPRSVRRGSWLSLRPSVRARDGRERVYVRPDSWSFVVRPPSGEPVRCAIPAGGGTPPPELFRRITERWPDRELLDADAFCPADTFERAGVYEVVPELHLAHSGEEWGYDAVTGRFAGPPTPIRITAGELGYVEQVPQRPDEADGEGEE